MPDRQREVRANGMPDDHHLGEDDILHRHAESQGCSIPARGISQMRLRARLGIMLEIVPQPPFVWLYDEGGTSGAPLCESVIHTWLLKAKKKALHRFSREK